MTVGFTRHQSIWRGAVMAFVLGLGGAGAVFAQATPRGCISGYEISPGTDDGGGVTQNVLFVGADNRPMPTAARTSQPAIAGRRTPAAVRGW